MSIEPEAASKPVEPSRRVAGLPVFARTLRLGTLDLAVWLPRYDEATLNAIVARHGLNETHWPYYLEDWPATLAMAEYLQRRHVGPPAEPLLDLGCGGGALSAFLYAAWGLEPYALDRNPEACALTHFNLRQIGGRGDRVACGDLTRSPWRMRFETLLAGEMLYAHELLPQVLAFLRDHLAPGGEALFADARRGSAAPFMARAHAEGFRVRRDELPGGKAHVYRVSTGA